MSHSSYSTLTLATEISSMLSNLSDGIALQQHEAVLGEKSKMGTKYAQSGKWLLDDSPEFASWTKLEEEGSRVLWLNGPGKSSQQVLQLLTLQFELCLLFL